MIQEFTKTNYQAICAELASKDADLKNIVEIYGYPPFWSRPNSFESLVHIILEQQVSLASALSALNKLKERLPELSPAAVLSLTDQQMRACYVSRQKNSYIKFLAAALLDGQIKLEEFRGMADDQVRKQLVALKGIGNWTADVYLMFALKRPDIFPAGDLAAVNALKRIKHLPAGTPVEEILSLTAQWKPYRTLAAMLLWHYYLSVPKAAVTPKR